MQSSTSLYYFMVQLIISLLIVSVMASPVVKDLSLPENLALLREHIQEWERSVDQNLENFKPPWRPDDQMQVQNKNWFLQFAFRIARLHRNIYSFPPPQQLSIQLFNTDNLMQERTRKQHQLRVFNTIKQPLILVSKISNLYDQKSVKENGQSLKRIQQYANAVLLLIKLRIQAWEKIQFPSVGMVEPGASVHPQGPVRAGTREDSEGAVGERQTPGTSQHVYTQSPAETQEDSEEAVGERQTPGPSQPVHPQSPAGTLEDSEVAVGGRLSPEPSRPVHSQTSAETRKDSEGAAGGRHTPEPTEKTIEELVKNIYTLVELGYVGQADHGLPMPTDRQLILQLKEFSGFQRYINPPPTLVQAQTKTSIDLHEGWHQVASSQHLPRPHFPISKQQYHIQLTQQWSINQIFDSLKNKLKQKYLATITFRYPNCRDLFLLYLKLIYHSRIKQQQQGPITKNNLGIALIKKLFKKHHCDLTTLNQLQKMNLPVSGTTRQLAFTYNMVGIYFIIIHKLQKQTADLQKILKIMRYLESLHIMLQTIVDNTDNRIHILLSAIFNLMVKVNSILDQKAKDLKFKCYAEYYDHQQEKKQIQRRSIVEAERISLDVELTQSQLVIELVKQNIRPVSYGPQSIYPDVPFPSTQPLILNAQRVVPMLQWANSEIKHLTTNPFADEACQTGYVQWIKRILITLAEVAITTNKDTNIQIQIQKALKQADKLLLGGRPVYIGIPWPFVKMGKIHMQWFQKALSRYQQIIFGNDIYSKQQWQRIISLVQILEGMMLHSTLFKKNKDGTYENEEAEKMIEQTATLLQHAEQNHKAAKSSNKWQPLNHESSQTDIVPVQRLDFVLDINLEIQPINFPRMQSLPFSSQLTHKIYKYYLAQFQRIIKSPLECPYIQRYFLKSAISNLLKIIKYLQHKNLIKSKQKATKLVLKILQKLKNDKLTKTQQLSRQAIKQQMKSLVQSQVYFPMPYGVWTQAHISRIDQNFLKLHHQLNQIARHPISTRDPEILRNIICKFQILALLLQGCHEKSQGPLKDFCAFNLKGAYHYRLMARRLLSNSQVRPFPQHTLVDIWMQCSTDDVSKIIKHFKTIYQKIVDGLDEEQNNLAFVGYLESVCHRLQVLIDRCFKQWKNLQLKHQKMEMYELKEFYCSLAQSSIEKVDFINQPLAFHYPIQFGQCNQQQKQWIQDTESFVQEFTEIVYEPKNQDNVKLINRADCYTKTLNLVRNSCPKNKQFLSKLIQDQSGFILNQVYPWTQLTYSRILRANSYFTNEFKILNMEVNSYHLQWKCGYLRFLYNALQRLKKDQQSFFQKQTNLLSKLEKKSSIDERKQQIIKTQTRVLLGNIAGYKQALQECSKKLRVDQSSINYSYSYSERQWCEIKWLWFEKICAELSKKRQQVLSGSLSSKQKIAKLIKILQELIQIHALARTAPIQSSRVINGDTIVLMITGEEGRILRALKTLEFDETSELFIGAVSTDGQFSGQFYSGQQQGQNNEFDQGL